MSIKKTTLSGWRLSGKDAEAFVKQVADDTPNPRAKAAAQRGEKLFKEYTKNGGFLIINPNANNKNYH